MNLNFVIKLMVEATAVVFSIQHVEQLISSMIKELQECKTIPVLFNETTPWEFFSKPPREKFGDLSTPIIVKLVS